MVLTKRDIIFVGGWFLIGLPNRRCPICHPILLASRQALEGSVRRGCRGCMGDSGSWVGSGVEYLQSFLAKEKVPDGWALG